MPSVVVSAVAPRGFHERNHSFVRCHGQGCGVRGDHALDVAVKTEGTHSVLGVTPGLGRHAGRHAPHPIAQCLAGVDPREHGVGLACWRRGCAARSGLRPAEGAASRLRTCFRPGRDRTGCPSSGNARRARGWRIENQGAPRSIAFATSATCSRPGSWVMTTEGSPRASQSLVSPLPAGLHGHDPRATRGRSCRRRRPPSGRRPRAYGVQQSVMVAMLLPRHPVPTPVGVENHSVTTVEALILRDRG